MGGNFLEFMKSMGIFILCAQSLMHFTAGKVYEKYVKLLIGIMILAQFTVQARAIFLGAENAQIWEEIEQFQRELDAVAQEAGRDAAASFGQGMGGTAGIGTGFGGAGGKGGDMEGVMEGIGSRNGRWDMEKKALEAEIKERLAGDAGSFGMVVEDVEIKEEPPKIIVMVSRGTGKTAGEDTEQERETEGKIKVGKITIAKDAGQDIADMPENEAEDLQGLAEAFSEALGTYSDYIEVIACSPAVGYGAGTE